MDSSKQATKTSAEQIHSAGDSVPSQELKPSGQVEIVPATPTSSTITEDQTGRSSDPKTLRWAMANKASARRARLRKKAYEEKLKQEAKEGEEKVASLTSQVDFYHHHISMLKSEKNRMLERMEFLKIYMDLREVENRGLMAEKERLMSFRDAQLPRGSGGSGGSGSAK